MLKAGKNPNYSLFSDLILSSQIDHELLAVGDFGPAIIIIKYYYFLQLATELILNKNNI